MKNWSTRTSLATATVALAVPLLAVSPAATADPGTFTAADRAFLADLAAEQTGSIGGTPRAKVELGVATCGALRTNPVQRVVDTGIASGIRGYDVGALIGAASWNYCPDTWPQVAAWAESV